MNPETAALFERVLRIVLPLLAGMIAAGIGRMMRG